MIKMERNSKTYVMIGVLLAAALSAGIVATTMLNSKNSTAATLPTKNITITQDSMPKTPEIDMQVAKLENGKEIPRPDIGGYEIKAGTDSEYVIHFVSHDSRDFDPILRVYNADNQTAENAAFARVALTEADKGFPDGLIATLVPNDHLPVKANSQATATLLVHTTSDLVPGQYRIAVGTMIDQDIDNEPVWSNVRGEIITIDVS